MGADSYVVWATNSSGSYTSTILNPVSGTISALESLDPSFLQVFFFNDTATTEIYPLSLHDALPISTDLDQVGSNYFLYAHGTSSGPELSVGGAAVTAGQFAYWTPLGTAQTASGY